MTNPQKERSSIFTEEQAQLVENKVLDPQWVTGFVDGEGCFHVSINKNKQSRLGQQVLPEFTIVQHCRDKQILDKLKKFFKCGVVRVNHGDRMSYRVRGFSHLCTIIIPFFEKYPLQTKKSNDFLLFKKIIFLMQKREHLCIEGIKKIAKIADLMNRKGNKISKIS